MGTAFVLRRLAVAAVYAFTACTALGRLLLFLGATLVLLLRVFLDVAVHSVNVLYAEARGKDGNLYLVAQLGVGGKSPLDFKLSVELCHKVVHVVHFLHHQAALVVALLAAEGYAEQDFLRVEDVVIVEQRRVQRVVDSLLHAAFSLAVAGAHDSYAAVFQYGLDVVEVKVDKSVDGYYLGNTLGSNAQRVVGLAESVED